MRNKFNTKYSLNYFKTRLWRRCFDVFFFMLCVNLWERFCECWVSSALNGLWMTMVTFDGWNSEWLGRCGCARTERLLLPGLVRALVIRVADRGRRRALASLVAVADSRRQRAQRQQAFAIKRRCCIHSRYTNLQSIYSKPSYWNRKTSPDF